MARKLVLVLAGGFCGAAIRYLLSQPLLRLVSALTGAHTGFPYDVLLINLSGAFAIGLLYGAFEQGAPISPDARLILGTGFLGAYTTFSSFMVGGGELLRSGHILLAALYLIGASLAGVALSFGGFTLAGRVILWREARWSRASEALAASEQASATAPHLPLRWMDTPSQELRADGGWQDAAPITDTARRGEEREQRLADAEGSAR